MFHILVAGFWLFRHPVRDADRIRQSLDALPEPRSSDRALRSAGCYTIFREKASGKAVKNRPQLERAIDALGTGDILIVAEWDRATRSMMDGISIMQRIAERGAAIKVLDKPHLDLTTPIGRGFLAFLSALAEDERGRIVQRAADGRSVARERGVKFGPKPKLSEHQRKKALDRLAAGDSCREIARDIGVSASTISRLQRPIGARATT